MNFRLPQDFIRHPVADAGKVRLQQQRRFDRQLVMTMQCITQHFARECIRRESRRNLRPPRRLAFALKIQHAAELPRIAEDERTVFLLQSEVVVFAWREVRWFDTESAGHPEMNRDPDAARKLKRHLFPARFGRDKLCAWQLPSHRSRVSAAKISFACVQFNRDDLRADARVPLLAIKFDFSQFRHGAEVMQHRVAWQQPPR